MVVEYYAGIGSRQTPPDVCERMTELAEYLYGAGFTLRSGGAAGADSAFELGSGDKKEIYLPWKGFNGNPSPLHSISSQAYELAARFHPAWDKCNEAARKFHGRNGYQVLGLDLKTPVKFVACWTMAGETGGGTGQALRIASHFHIPIYNFYWDKDGTIENFFIWYKQTFSAKELV